MKTDDLIRMLATDTTPVPSHRIEGRFAAASLVGLLGAGVLMLAFFGLRPDLQSSMVLPMFWGKLVFAAALATAGVALLLRMGRPGMSLGLSVWWLALPVVVLWAMALLAVGNASPAERLPMVLGTTWRSCPFNIGLLSVPALAGMLWALKGAAPTHLAWTGAGAGVLAGALAALVYALHCPEMQAPFLAVWYVAGIALPTLVGAVLGPRVLRW